MSGDDDFKARAAKIRYVLNLDMDRTDDISVQRYTRTGRKKTKLNRELHENSRRALENNRAGTQFNGPNVRRCRLCRRVAVRELDVCYWHGGRSFVHARRRALKRGPVGKTSEIATKNTRAIFRARLVPPELFQVPLFMELAEYALPGVFRHKYTSGDNGRRTQARMIVREMILAWVAAQEGDPGPWATAVAKARAMGFTG